MSHSGDPDKESIMTRFACVTALLTVTVGVGTIAPAAGPLDRFSTDTDVVIRLKAPETTVEKLAGLADAIQPGTGDMLRHNTTALGKGIFVPGLTGVDTSQDWYVLLFSQGRKRPAVYFAIPATDAEQLASALPDRMTSHVEGNWVLYTDSDAGIPAPAGTGEGISSVLTGESAAVFDRGDLSLFVNVDHLTSVYRDDLAKAQQQVHEGLKFVAQMASQGNEMNLQPIMDMYGTICDAVFQMLADARGSAVGVTITAEGIGIEKHATFVAGSTTSRVLAAQPTSSMESLARLPAGAGGYFAIRGDMQRFMEWGWSVNAMMLGDDEEKKRQFEESVKAWKEVEFGEMVGSFSVGAADAGLFQYTAVAHASPIDKLRKTMYEMTELMSTMDLYGIKQEMKFEPNAETIGSRKVDLMTLKQEYPPELDPTGMQAKMQEVMFGPDGIATRIAYLEDAYVMAMGGGRETMESLLTSYDSKSNAEISNHRRGLIAEPNILVLLDLPSLAVQGATALAAIPEFPIPIDTEALSVVPLETSYVGYSLACEPDSLRVQLAVPVEQLRGIAALVGFVQQLRP
jgi:hypothetical protein